MELKLVLQNSQLELETAILGSLRDLLNKRFKQVQGNIKEKVKKILDVAIRSQPEYQSLFGGKLQAELGVPDPRGSLETIINIWLSSVTIIMSPISIIGKQLRGGFLVVAVKSDYSDVLGTYAAQIVTEKSQMLPWLQWLLLEGDRRIVLGYRVRFGYHRGSRTGLAIMKKDPVRSWGVPSEFAGTDDNNFIIRAINSVENEIGEIIKNAL